MALVVAAIGLLIAAAVVLKLNGENEAYTTVRELSPLVIAILAAYLASRFQARAAFHTSLREVWSVLIEAKNELVAYTMIPSPGIERYAQTYKQLSKAIDEVRGVYLNVGEDDWHRGHFPYEPLHDMRLTLESLGDAPSDAAREQAREEFKRSWRALRPAFLAEFEPPEPTRSITDPNERDKRANSRAPRSGRRSWSRRVSRL